MNRARKAMLPNPITIKPSNRAIQHYYETLRTYASYNATNEGALETAFSNLLQDTARLHSWTLLPKQPLNVGNATIIPDGVMLDSFNLRRGYWEAKLDFTHR